MEGFDHLVMNPVLHDALAILKGARNGFVYGVRVRAPHAFIMSVLFGRGDWRQRLLFIYRATRQHATNLAKFVTIYKTALLLQRRLLYQGKPRSIDTFLAGLIGGWAVFGQRNAVNEQIVLYVLSRVITSYLPRAQAGPPKVAPSTSATTIASNGRPIAHPPGFPYPKSQPPDSKVFEYYAALTWGAVMWLFANRRQTLHGGMVSSMQYLYLDSEVWNGLKTLLWHNN